MCSENHKCNIMHIFQMCVTSVHSWQLSPHYPQLIVLGNQGLGPEASLVIGVLRVIPAKAQGGEIHTWEIWLMKLAVHYLI